MIQSLFIISAFFLELDYITKIGQDTYKFSIKAQSIIDWIKDKNLKKAEKQKEETRAESLTKGIDPDKKA